MRRFSASVVVLSTLVVAAFSLPVASAPGDTVVRFSAAGDFSSSTAARAVLSGVGALDNDLHLALGDLSYGATGAEQSWCDLVTDHVGAGYPFELVAGNHESGGLNGNINDFSACLPNQLPGAVGTYGRQYFVDVPANAPLVRYIMVSPSLPFSDGTWSYAAGSPRYNWTAAAVDGARAAGVPWVVVGMHRPCLSVGQYGCEGVQDLTNMLHAKKVDLVLAGHEHHYSRSKQLALGPSCTALMTGAFDPDCVVDSDDSLVKGAGTVTTTIGTGGIPLRDVYVDDPEYRYFSATSGANMEPAFGFVDFAASVDTLTASFRPVAGGVFTDSFTITAGPEPANLPPTAGFSHTVENLTVTATSTSTDVDGQIASYDWDFGDGTAATTSSVTHTYAAAGTYDLSLTVTDDDGASAVWTEPVTVSDPPGPVTTTARDAFERTVTNGWGTADLGGTWSVGTASLFSVAQGEGRIRMPSAGSAPPASLNGPQSSDTELRLEVGLDKPSTGTGTIVRVQPRRLANGDGYLASLRYVANGSVTISLVRIVGTQTFLTTSTVGGVTYQVGDRLAVRAQATGTSPTTLRAKVWKVGSPEPSLWSVATTDSTASLQAAGGIGTRAVLASAATNAPVTAFFDNLWAGPTR